MANVIFKTGTRAQYNALAVKDTNTLYWLIDTMELFKGDVLFGKGANAAADASGLMSPEDKKKLDQISGAGILNLTPTDSSIIISDVEGGKSVGVQISKEANNAIVLKADGLYANTVGQAEIPEYRMEKQAVAADGFSATYKLKKISGQVSTYVGDDINIPKDLVIQSGSVKTVTEENVPYAGAAIGDAYIDIVLSDPSSSHIYIPAKGIVDVSNKVDKIIDNADGSRSMVWNEASGGGAMFTHSDKSQSFVGVSDGGLTGMMAQIYADKQDETGKWVGSRINVYHDRIYYTSLADKAAGKENNDVSCEIATKGDVAKVAESIVWQEM